MTEKRPGKRRLCPPCTNGLGGHQMARMQESLSLRERALVLVAPPRVKGKYKCWEEQFVLGMLLNDISSRSKETWPLLPFVYDHPYFHMKEQW